MIRRRRTELARWASGLALIATACATAPAEEPGRSTEPPHPAITSTPVPQPVRPLPRPFSTRDFLAEHGSLRACEPAARELLARSADDGWSALTACVRSRNFFGLDVLMAAPWLPEVATRSDASELVAQLIAERGGDVQTDLLVIKSRLPLYTLAQASAEPDHFRGRLVVLLAVLDDEQSGSDADVDVTEIRRRQSQQGAQAWMVKGKFDDAPASTGLTASVRVGPRTRLAKGQEYVLLTRFKGATLEDSGETTLHLDLLKGFKRGSLPIF